jgi:hypothetical protein
MEWKKKIVPFVVFFIVANPEAFKLTRSIAGDWVASSYGVPTTAGLLLHALVYVLLAHFVWKMLWGKKSGFVHDKRGRQLRVGEPADFGGGCE